MSIQQLLIYYVLFIFKLNNAYKTCFKESNHINYLFLNDMSQIKIPLLPLDCFHCQSAYQVDIQLIDEELFLNRTIQRIKIFLKNFEIEDSSYICLRNICPIIVEYGSDSIFINITSSLFSHVYLSFIYLNSINNSIICTIQTRFSILSLNKSLICTDKIYLHPYFNIQIIRQLFIYDCQAYLFKENIYQISIKFNHFNFLTNNQIITMKSSEKPCEYILENINYLNNISLIQTKELFTTVNIFPFYNPWKKDIQTLGPCRTKIIPYQHMFFTNDIVNIRNINIEQGQTIQIRCPIDGSEKYLKYIWYYQRYQPKYQISNNRIIILSNITEQMQGKYMCIGDDGNEKLEFEMTLYVLQKHNKTNKNSFYLIIILILILFFFILIFIIYILLKKSSLLNYLIKKQNSLIIHHDVILTIQHLSKQKITKNSLWNQSSYYTFDYIDQQSIYDITSNSQIRQEQIPYQFSTRHRNINGQPLIQSNNDKFNQISNSNDIKILKISIPLLNQYPLIKSTSSIISFDSQIELNEFNQMTFVCMDNESLSVDKQS